LAIGQSALLLCCLTITLQQENALLCAGDEVRRE